MIFYHRLLSEKRTFAAFAVISDTLLYNFTGGVVILRKAVYAVKFIGVSGDELTVYRYIVTAQSRTAFYAGTVI